MPGWAVLRQHTEADKLVVEVASTATVAVCPHGGRVSGKVHDRRAQRKKDVPLGSRTVDLVVWRRHLRGHGCRTPQGRPRTFSEPEVGRGRGPKGRVRRTTERLRQRLSKQVRWQTVTRVAQDSGVGQRLVRACFAALAAGLVLPQRTTPRMLALDDCSLRRGIRYHPMGCDLEQRWVQEVWGGRDDAAVRPDREGLPHPQQVAARSALLRDPDHLTGTEHRAVAERWTAWPEVRRAWLNYPALRRWCTLKASTPGPSNSSARPPATALGRTCGSGSCFLPYAPSP
ncbi:MAG: hypothetical protein HY689_12160 [Chloroflexi bacterium]|nr:hypothetical protein [Chloroflexota bacterium]